MDKSSTKRKCLTYYVSVKPRTPFPSCCLRRRRHFAADLRAPLPPSSLSRSFLVRRPFAPSTPQQQQPPFAGPARLHEATFSHDGRRGGRNEEKEEEEEVPLHAFLLLLLLLVLLPERRLSSYNGSRQTYRRIVNPILIMTAADDAHADALGKTD
jgi:hypothetical protein